MQILTRISLTVLCLSGCSAFLGCPSLKPATVFRIVTTDQFPGPPVGVPGSQQPLLSPRPFTWVYGYGYVPPNSTPPAGAVDSYAAYTDLYGKLDVKNADVPNTWDHYVDFILSPTSVNDPCQPLSVSVGNPNIISLGDGLFKDPAVPMVNLDIYDWNCQILTAPPSASTHFAIQGSLPATVTMSGAGKLTSTYGYPKMYIYGYNTSAQDIFNVVTATSIAPDGSTATFPFPTNSDGTPLPPSVYTTALVNVNSDGSFSPAGPNYLSIGATQTFISPVGVGAQVVTTHTVTQTKTPQNGGCGSAKGSSQNTTGAAPFPVVTQYTQNNVNNSGTLLPVGAGPTAIALYDTQSYTTTINQPYPACITGTRTISQKARAVVANTGGNSVTVLDLHSNLTLATITVGADPSAIALSADEKYAFVTNSGDGTVSLLDLTAMAQTAKVSVGTSPQAIAVAPDTSVWVGGSGFVAHLSASTLQSLGTYPTNGTTITSLKYSTYSSELLGTAVSAGGASYVQEINTTSTASAGSFTVTAQRQTATLPMAQGTGGILHPYYTGAFRNTATPLLLGSSTVIGQGNNDGWLSISPTSSGFTVTDTYDHIDYMDGVTSAPVTSIAVDQAEQVAYLATPDGNGVITIYIPSE